MLRIHLQFSPHQLSWPQLELAAVSDRRRYCYIRITLPNITKNQVMHGLLVLQVFISTMELKVTTLFFLQEKTWNRRKNSWIHKETKTGASLPQKQKTRKVVTDQRSKLVGTRLTQWKKRLTENQEAVRSLLHSSPWLSRAQVCSLKVTLRRTIAFESPSFVG